MFYPGRVGIDEGEYLGRPSVLGNPFVIGKDGNRAKVCKQYEDWFYAEIDSENPQVIHELRRLYKLGRNRDLKLLCFCHPQQCHTETVCNFLNQYLR